MIVALILASSIAALDPATLPEQSTLIATGCVESTHVVRDDKAGLIRMSTVRIASVLKGTAPKRILIYTRTGLVFFDRHLARGETGVFFLKPSAKGTYEAAYPGGFALFPEHRAECR